MKVHGTEQLSSRDIITIVVRSHHMDYPPMSYNRDQFCMDKDDFIAAMPDGFLVTTQATDGSWVILHCWSDVRFFPPENDPLEDAIDEHINPT